MTLKDKFKQFSSQFEDNLKCTIISNEIALFLNDLSFLKYGA